VGESQTHHQWSSLKNNPALAQNLRQRAVVTPAFGSKGMTAAATNARIFAHATEALLSRLATVNG
jgi:hypothetical protein